MKHLKRAFIAFISICLNSFLIVNAADIKDISIITDKIILIHFNEGHIDYTGLGESDFRNFKMYYSLLDLTKAKDLKNYSLISKDDPNYLNTQKNPVNIGRKSKMAHVGNMYNTQVPDFLNLHSIYIEFSDALVPGKTYTLKLNQLSSSFNEWTFTFDPKQIRSETIHVNQLGFNPMSSKYAYLSQFMGDFNTSTHSNGGLNLSNYSNKTFKVIKTDDLSEVFSGQIVFQKSKTEKDSERSGDYGANKNFSNADVWQCDFSQLTTPGTYKIVVENMGSSFPFEINSNIYQEAFYKAMRALYFQRSGIYKEVKEYNNLLYPASFQNNKMYKVDKGRGEYGIPTDLSKEVKNIWGWYFDAGDWDGIIYTHAKVPAILLLAYEMWPEKFRDGDIGNRWKRNESDPWIDEGTNGIPDILDEAKWLIDFMKRAREALQAQGYGTGGVPSYVGVNAGSGGSYASWTDTRNLNCTNQDAGVTAIHAGLCGWLSSALKIAGRPQIEIDYYKDEAISAYNWAKSNGAIGKEFHFSAAGLFKATGELIYQNDFIKDTVKSWDYWAGPEFDQYAESLYALLPDTHPNLIINHRTMVRNKIQTATDQYWVVPGSTRGFRATHISSSQRNFLGTFSTPRTMLPSIMYRLNGESKYLNSTQYAADYCLGGNQMNMVWMSGLGDRFDEQPFHPDSWCLLDFNHKAYVNPILPGFVSYGSYVTCDWSGCGFDWEGDEDFSRSSAYPPIVNDATTLFPQGEARFPNRVNIPGSEYTVHQTLLHAAFTYGILVNNNTGGFVPNVKPSVELLISDSLEVAYSDTLVLKANTSDDTRKVEYYYDWRLIGTSFDYKNNFEFNWNLNNYKTNVNSAYLITAKAYDDQGTISTPSKVGEKTIKIVQGDYAIINVNIKNGTVSINPQKSVYNVNEQVTLTATPNQNYEFKNWSGDITGTTNPITINLNTNKTVTANFSSIPFDLNVINGTGTGKYGIDTEIEISANKAPEGKIFDLWTGDTLTVQNTKASTTKIIMPSKNISVTATYKDFNKYFLGTPFKIPGKIKLEEYNKGGEGYAYHDADPVNGWTVFRTSEGVDINEITVGGADYFIGNIVADEWINYGINVETTGKYDATINYSSGASGGNFYFKIDGVKVGTSIVLGGTGGWKTFNTLIASNLQLTSGNHELTVYMETAGFNLKDLDFTLKSTSIKDNDVNSDISWSIYPNPLTINSPFLNIMNEQNSDFEIEISNLSGKVLIRKKSNLNIETIDIKEFTQGMYLVTIKSASNIYTSKIIIY